MSHLANQLLSRGGLLKTVVVGAVLAASVAANAAGVDAPATPFHIGDSAVQAQTFDALVGFAAVPLSATEAETFDAERFRWRKVLPRLPKPRRCWPASTPGAPSICI